MKGILPFFCRPLGYAIMILSVFSPMFIYMFGLVDDTNFIYIKFGMKFLVWVSLFMVFVAKHKDECEEIAQLRSRSLTVALYVWVVWYIVALCKGLVDNELSESDNSIGIIYMILSVLVLEFLTQKRKMDSKRR